MRRTLKNECIGLQPEFHCVAQKAGAYALARSASQATVKDIRTEPMKWTSLRSGGWKGSYNKIKEDSSWGENLLPFNHDRLRAESWALQHMRWSILWALVSQMGNTATPSVGGKGLPTMLTQRHSRTPRGGNTRLAGGEFTGLQCRTRSRQLGRAGMSGGGAGQDRWRYLLPGPIHSVGPCGLTKWLAQTQGDPLADPGEGDKMFDLNAQKVCHHYTWALNQSKNVYLLFLNELMGVK